MTAAGVMMIHWSYWSHWTLILMMMILSLLLMMMRPGWGHWTGGHGLDWGHLTGLLQHLLKIHDVVHCLGQNIHFGHLLHLSSSGDMHSQSLKSSVNSFHSVPLSLISLDSFQVLLRLDGVAMDGMNHQQFRSWSHDCYLC